MKKIFIRIGKVAALSLAGIIVLYLILGFIIVPLFAPMVINKQASKMTGHHVVLQSVKLNPLTLSLELRHLKITDSKQAELIGFERLAINIKTLKLLQGQYNIQYVTIVGMRINAVLMADNKLNLLQMRPKPNKKENMSSATTISKTSETAQTAEVSAESPRPKLAINKITLKRCALTFADQSIGKGFVLHCDPFDMEVTGFTTEPDSQVKVNLNSVIDGQGKLVVEALAKPFNKRPDLDTVITLSDYALQALTPYVGKYTGRAIKDGSQLNLKFSYKIDNQNLNANHQVQIKDYQFGNKVKSSKAMALPFDLIVALLKNQQGHIDVSLPVTGNMNDPKFDYFPVLGKMGMDFLLNIVTSPVKALVSLLPSSDGDQLSKQDIDVIYFAPNSAEITKIEKEKLNLIAKAFKIRNQLTMTISGTYDPNIDGQAVKKPSEANQTALTNLAEKRSMAVYQTLIARGLKSDRIKQTGIRSVHANQDKVPLKLKLATR